MKGEKRNMQVESTATKVELNRRLRRIEGQVRGVQRMIDENRDCREILQQLAAVRSAIQQTSLTLLRCYAAQCFDSEDVSRDALVEELMTIIGRAA